MQPGWTKTGLLEEVDRFRSNCWNGIAVEQRIDALDFGHWWPRAEHVLYKLHRKGLNAVCIPRSLENDIACDHGFARLQQRAQFHDRDAGPRARGREALPDQIGVVEVLGANTPAG